MNLTADASAAMGESSEAAEIRSDERMYRCVMMITELCGGYLNLVVRMSRDEDEEEDEEEGAPEERVAGIVSEGESGAC